MKFCATTLTACLIALCCAWTAPRALAQDCGDCNGDGFINATDALVAAKIAAGLVIPTASQLVQCDVDNSLTINPLDTLAIAKFVVGILATLNCPPPGVPYDIGFQPLAVRIADINMDGHLDIIVGLDPPGVAVGSPGGVVIRYGRDDPATGSTAIDWSMATSEVLPSPTSSGVSRILVGDIDHDGRTDLLTVEFETGTFTFRPGTQPCPGTSVSFAGSIAQTYVTYGAVPGAGSIAGGTLADVDVDGDLDFVTIGAINGIVVYLFDSSTGTFATDPSFPPGPPATALGEILRPQDGLCTLTAPYDPVDIAVADVSKNGLPDIIGAYAASASIVVFKQEMQELVGFQGNGSIDRHREGYYNPCTSEMVPQLREYTTSGPTGSGFFPATVLAGDMDRDGSVDLVTISAFTGSVSFLKNTGVDGEFGAPVERDLGLTGVALTINAQLVDLNRDGVLDLVATSESADDIIFVEGRVSSGGAFTFAAVHHLAASVAPSTPANPSGLDVADLDEDGANDLVVAATRTGQFQILDLTTLGGLSASNFISFNTAISYETGQGPVDIASESFFGADRFQDIVTANSSGSLDFFQGFPTEGAGLRFPPLNVPLAGSGPVAVAAGNLDGLVDADVAVSDNLNNRVLVLLHNGNTTVTATPMATPPFILPPASYALPAGPNCSPRDIKIALINNDQWADIIVACELRNSIVVLQNSPASPGNFGILPMLEFDTSPSLLGSRACNPANFAGCGPRVLAIGNVDNDTGLDVVTGNNFSYDVSVLLNDGSGNLALSGVPTSVPPTGSGSVIAAMCLGDFDLDTSLDFALASSNPSGSSSHIFIFGGNGSGGFATVGGGVAAALATHLGISDMACRDLDGDMDPDLVIASSGEGVISVAINRINEAGVAPFTYDPLECPAGGNPTALVVSDVSGDGNLDIITANPGVSSSVTFIPGRPGGKFLCTLTQNIPGGILDMTTGYIDDDLHLDVITVLESGQVVVLFGTGLNGDDEFSFEDDVFEYDPVNDLPAHLVAEDLVQSSFGPLAVAAADFDADGDTDIAVLYSSLLSLGAQQYSTPGVEIFYNTDRTTRGSYSLEIIDSHPINIFVWRPALPFLDATGAPLTPVALAGRDATAADLKAVDVNLDGLMDLVALVPSTGGTGGQLVITLHPGITGDPNDVSFEPLRFVDWQGYISEAGCTGHAAHVDLAPGTAGTKYGPAVAMVDCMLSGGITQFSFDLGAGSFRSISITDSYPQDGNLEVVVADEMSGMLQVFTVDHAAPLATVGRMEWDAMLIPSQGYPPGDVSAAVLFPFSFMGANPSGIVHADLDNNGYMDAIGSLFADASSRGYLASSQPSCAGMLPLAQGFAARPQGVLVDAGDYNRDGKIDALVVSELAEVASAFYIDPLSSPAMLTQFVPRVDHVLGIGTQTDLLEGDFNRDGYLDVLISTTGQRSQLTILRGVGN